MKKPIVTRNYKLSDAVLKQKADEFVGLMERDKAEFEDRGLDKDGTTNFVAAIQNVNELISDETYDAAKIGKTAEKDAARSILEKRMRTIFNMAEMKYGIKSAEYRSFGNAEISRQSDAELFRTCKVMAIAAKEKLEDLQSEGLTQGKIDALIAQGIILDDNIDAVAKGISDRDLATESRIETLNTLYALLMKYASTGQDIFYEVNEAKYNDYVIYDTPSGLPEDPEPPIVP